MAWQRQVPGYLRAQRWPNLVPCVYIFVKYLLLFFVRISTAFATKTRIGNKPILLLSIVPIRWLRIFPANDDMSCWCVTKCVTITRPHWVETLRASSVWHGVELMAQICFKISCNSYLYNTYAYRWLRAKRHSIANPPSYYSLALSPRYMSHFASVSSTYRYSRFKRHFLILGMLDLIR